MFFLVETRNIWIVSKENQFLVIVESYSLLYYLSSEDRDLNGVRRIEGSCDLWLSLTKHNALIFESSDEAKFYLVEKCGCREYLSTPVSISQ